MTARDDVLARIRSAISGEPTLPAIIRDYRTTGDLEPSDALELFAERVADYRATVHRVSADDVGAVVASILADARSVVVPDDLSPDWLAGVSAAIVRDDGSVTTAALDETDAVVTSSSVAIAETGTIVLDGGTGQGRRALSLVPDHHICVVAAEAVVATVPEGLARLDPRRPLTMISGPSATSDIELDRVEGVHGPRVLDVVIVDRPSMT